MKINAGTLSNYLTATLENAQDHAAEAPQLMFLVDQMDEIFQREIFAHDFDAPPTAALLVMNAYTMLLSAVRQALSGHVVTTYPVARAALESACYAFLIARDETKSDIWFDRHTSQKALKTCRQTFTAKSAADELKLIDPVMAEYVLAYYDASIDFGAHPNRKSVTDHLEDSGAVGEGLHGFELTGVYGRNSWQVNQALLACVEAGLAIVFLTVASSEKHPLVHERASVYQNWMDEKNRVLSELKGGTVDGKGPIYCSVTPPQ